MWHKAARVVGATVKLLIGVPVLMVTVLSLALLTSHVFRDQPVIRPIAVAEELRDSGYTESVIAKRLADEMSDISWDAADYVSGTSARLAVSNGDSRSPNSVGQGHSSEGDWSLPLQLDQPDITIPGSGTSLDLIAAQIRELFSLRDREVTGELTKAGPRLQLRLRFSSWSKTYTHTMESHPRPGDLDTAVDWLVQQAAIDLMAEVRPYIAAAYYLKDKNDEHAAELIARTLREEPADDDAWAYFLWARLDMDRQGISLLAAQKSEQKYYTALRVRPDMLETYFNLANVLVRNARYREADDIYEKAYAAFRERALPPHAMGYLAGDESAQVALGFLYESGVGVARDLGTAATWYQRAADRGYADAQFRLGLLYEYEASGPAVYGQPNRINQAAYWYGQAASRGHAEAQFRLARLYESGRIGRDEEKRNESAFYWYRRAADSGIAAAQNNLGVMYWNGRGVEQDLREAIICFWKAAEQGEPAAMLQLAMMYQGGHEVIKDEVMAENLFVKAVNLGSIPAMNQLAWLWAGQPERWSEARKLAETAVNENPRNGAYHDTFGWVLYQMGQYSDAAVQLEKAVAQHAEWPRYEHPGDAYNRLSCPERAHNAWSAALEAVQKKESDAASRNDVPAEMDMHVQSVRLAIKLTNILTAAGNSPASAGPTVPPPCPV